MGVMGLNSGHQQSVLLLEPLGEYMLPGLFWFLETASCLAHALHITPPLASIVTCTTTDPYPLIRTLVITFRAHQEDPEISPAQDP